MQSLAKKHAPLIRFDNNEPFLPSKVGYTVFHDTQQSDSFPREIHLKDNVHTVIEYAIWWDWDIQHLYELEHIWVYLDDDEMVVHTEASWHGKYNAMIDNDGVVPLQDGRVIVHSEPGKHAFAPTRDILIERSRITRMACSKRAGSMGVHVTPLFDGIIHDRTPPHNQLVHTYLETQIFEPSFEFSRIFDLRDVEFVTWHELKDWIPDRVNSITRQLHDTIPANRRRVLRIAHRGASAYAQEGSKLAIVKADEMGADMIEVDIRITADNVPVIVHDADLIRLFGIDKQVNDCDYDELLNLTPPEKEPILDFDGLAKLCRHLGMSIYLDIKAIDTTTLPILLDILRQHHLLKYSIFGSGNFDWLADIRHQEPKALTSILFRSVYPDPVLLAQSVKCDYVHPCWERFEQPHKLIAGEWMTRVTQAGFGVVCWNELRPAVIHELKQLGVTAICSDKPDLLT